ncbi:MAG TPA: choice-of-anchor B family protein [Bacteroidia bacterium]|nr:choice-of-anchor B family protein [Bacteroidia bacterium]
MKKLILSAAILFMSLASKAQFDYQNITWLGQFNDSSVVAEPVYGIRYQSCWGWVDPITQREYGIIGSTTGTYIIEVTNPTVPVERDYIPGKSSARIWHEYKTYGNYLYAIADGGNNTLQIMDLSYLPDSVHVVHDTTTIFDSGHTLYIDGDRMYVASVSKPGSPYSSMSVYSLSDPENPVLMRRLDQDYPAINQVHDMFVVNDTVYASCGYDGLYIYHYNESSNQFQQLGSLTTYPDQGYNHSSFLSRDHTMLYMCDEVPDGMAVKVVDVTDLLSPTVVDTFYSNPGATAHNPYVIDDQLFIAYYQDGVYAYDISVPSAPVKTGYFDTHPQNPPGTYPGTAYQGCWSVYTDLPSGILLASDMQLGLFVLDVSQLTGIDKSAAAGSFSAYPNPADNEIRIKNTLADNKINKIELIDLGGRVIGEIAQNNMTSVDLRLSTQNYPAGFYILRVQTDSKVISQKIQIQH